MQHAARDSPAVKLLQAPTTTVDAFLLDVCRLSSSFKSSLYFQAVYYTSLLYPPPPKALSLPCILFPSVRNTPATRRIVPPGRWLRSFVQRYAGKPALHSRSSLRSVSRPLASNGCIIRDSIQTHGHDLSMAARRELSTMGHDDAHGAAHDGEGQQSQDHSEQVRQ